MNKHMDMTSRNRQLFTELPLTTSCVVQVRDESAALRQVQDHARPGKVAARPLLL